MRATVVIPTLNARQLLSEALEHLDRQTVDHDVIVVDNGSADGTADHLAEAFPRVRVVHLPENVGFGRAVNRGLELVETDVVVLVNNDVLCRPDFLEQLLAPLSDEEVASVAGVLLQHDRPELVDTAGIELDTTLRSWDALWNRPVTELDAAREPVGPCGGAAAFRTAALREVGGFDESFFAYWEDVDLALRLQLAGRRCVRAPAARALHKHGQTLGAASPMQRRLEAYGRAYVLARYRVARRGLIMRVKIAVLDWPVLAVHLLVRREASPLRERWRGTRAGLRRPPLRAPLELATVSFREALSRQANLLRLRATGALPSHFDESSAQVK
ncbi:MAG TPA: glycosyltransferase family 2 protein [Gaiellaceae bacterium]|nr:glycosyltransferase family 2 protein [Gaiellaceae bacterium]